MVYHVGPFLLRALLPWHDSRNETDPQWMQEWIEGYARMPQDQPLPLIDTHHPDMPVPFEAPSPNPPPPGGRKLWIDIKSS